MGLVPILKRGVEEILHINHTSIVDEDIDSAKLLQCRIGKPERFVNASQVSVHGMAGAPMLFNPLSRGLKTDGVATTDHQFRTGGQRNPISLWT